jgi:hypothetical protein
MKKILDLVCDLIQSKINTNTMYLQLFTFFFVIPLIIIFERCGFIIFYNITNYMSDTKPKPKYRMTLIFAGIITVLFFAAVIFLPNFSFNINFAEKLRLGPLIEEVFRIIIDLLKSTWKAII